MLPEPLRVCTHYKGIVDALRCISGGCGCEQVLSGSSEFQAVQGRMAETMPHSTIHKLQRVQNVALWDYYSMQKGRHVRLGTNPHEVSVWHGTSQTDPAVIYTDMQDGFMVTA